MAKTICVNGVNFERIDERSLKKHGLTNMLFFLISQSGAIDRCGRIYCFFQKIAFFMDENDYKEGFIDELLLSVPDWSLINVYFCDFVIINPKIHDFFVQEMCARDLHYYWFRTAKEVYKENFCE